MVGSAELPGVGEKDGDDFAGFEADGDESAGQRFNHLAVFSVGEATIAGSVDDGGLTGNVAAAFEDEVVDKAAARVGVELGAEHARGDCSGNSAAGLRRFR
jgi:hypothetical protein